MAPLFFCSLPSEEEHDDEDDDEEDEDSDEDVGKGGGMEVDSKGCSPWWLADDVGGRGMSARGGPSISPVER